MRIPTVVFFFLLFPPGVRVRRGHARRTLRVYSLHDYTKTVNKIEHGGDGNSMHEQWHRNNGSYRRHAGSIRRSQHKRLGSIQDTGLQATNNVNVRLFKSKALLLSNGVDYI